MTYAKNNRYCEHKDVIELAKYAKGRIKTFVVSLSYAEVESVAEVFDYIQIHEEK